MITIPGRHGGLNRREFLRLGALGLGGLTLADLLRNEARGTNPGRPKSIIYVVLPGGPSHIDSYDLKPEAPAEYRGPFRPIQTRLSGVRICELMPLQASIMDKLALLRGICSVENDHFLSEVYTGLPRSAGQRPAFGSVASRLGTTSSPLPTYVSLQRESDPYEVPHYAGPQHAPFRPFGSVLESLAPVRSLEKLQDRRELLATFDRFQRGLDANTVRGADRFQAQALDIITSPRVRNAFDLSKESDRVVESYGRGKFTHAVVKDILYDWPAKNFLLARRLVEAGVRVVTFGAGSWDHHGSATTDIFVSLRHQLAALDRSLFALVNDLRDRGLDKDVLVVVLGEFGRTPKIEQPGPGRGHWAEAGCAVLFGGGLRMGQVIGETDSRAERARSGRITFQNIVATIYHTLGVDPTSQLLDFNGRPQFLLDDPEPIRELMA